MKVISLNGRSKLHLKNTCAAIGIFDGMHCGHQYLIKQMLSTSKRLNARSMVITFFPHPVHVLRPDVKLEYLSSLQDRLGLLADWGVDICLVVRFDLRFAHMEPRKFIENILVKQLGVKAVFVGEDFRFGNKRLGDIALLQELSVPCGYEMHATSRLKQGREIISSTRIRQLVSTGKLNQAARLLCREVSVCGTVVKGSLRGRTLGYPTANIAYEADIIPPKGVYVVRARLGKKSYTALANIGTRPSFEKQNSKLYLEVYILDFSKDIYGQRMQVEFLKKIRNEKIFPDPQSLIRQIQKDESLARKN